MIPVILNLCHGCQIRWWICKKMGNYINLGPNLLVKFKKNLQHLEKEASFLRILNHVDGQSLFPHLRNVYTIMLEYKRKNKTYHTKLWCPYLRNVSPCHSLHHMRQFLEQPLVRQGVTRKVSGSVRIGASINKCL